MLYSFAFEVAVTFCRSIDDTRRNIIITYSYCIKNTFCGLDDGLERLPNLTIRNFLMHEVCYKYTKTIFDAIFRIIRLIEGE
jgi:hypothetical protein